MEHILVTFLSILPRFLAGTFHQSGYGKKPLHGDFEAQRHWMEITLNLPIKQWYENGTNNDLMYWGLDYPPLTAYHSWLCGAVANRINSSWVELETSRGLETEEHKLFMRITVVVADLLIYFPAVFVFFSSCAKLRSHKIWCCIIALLYPGLILIDHGHFQYNCISLGFALWGIVGICKGRDLLASVAFVLALNYKQMELYHAMPFFCYLLATCIHGKENGFFKLVKLGVVVIATFLVCWLPYLDEPTGALQVLRRLFPFDRGLYEDKVANVWCSVSPVLKLKELLDQQILVLISMAATLMCLLPSSVHLLVRPSPKRFIIALVISSLTFFLFSFQVHEKSILIAALPVLLLWPEAPYMCTWFLQISTFSMLPLLIKDQLTIPYFALVFMYYVITKTVARDLPQYTENVNLITKIAGLLSILGALCLSIASITLTAPPRYPDLWAVLISIYSCAHFLVFFVYFNYWQCVSEMSDNTSLADNFPSGDKKSSGEYVTMRRVEVTDRQHYEEVISSRKSTTKQMGKNTNKRVKLSKQKMQ